MCRTTTRGFFVPLAYQCVPNENNYPTKRMISIYPIGLPLHMAAGVLLLGWRYGPFVINPLLGTLSLLLIYLVGRQLGLPRAYAVAGAAILAVNPTFVFMASQPMSDALAMFWGLVLISAALRARVNDKWALLAGAAFGVAFLVRPTNVLLLLPLAFCLPLKPRTLLLFGLGGLPLAVVFGIYNYAAFGNPPRKRAMARPICYI